MTLPRVATSPKPDRFWYSALLISALALLLHGAWTVAARSNAAISGAGGDALALLESTVATLAVGLVAGRKMRRREQGRYAWGFLTLALLANAAGDVGWWLIYAAYGELPVPSLADAVYLAFYPLFAIGLVLLPTSPHRPGERLRLAIDMASALLAGVLLFWMFGVGPRLIASEMGDLGLAVALAYPAGDIALLWALLLLLSRPVSPESRPALKLLAAGAAVMLFTDTLYSWQVVRDMYASGGFLDLGYSLMSILFALGAVREWHVPPPTGAKGPAPAAIGRTGEPLVEWTLGLPYAAMLLAFALLVWDHFRPTGVPFPVLALFLGGIIALLSARQVLAAWEYDALRQTERELTEGLLRARRQLEVRVEERTYELQKANAALEGEIAEHERAEAELLASLKEKEVLLKEVHHRVKNNLQIVNSLFSLQGQAAKDPALTDALLDGQARIKAMSLIHEKLYASPDLAHLDFGDYLRVLVAHLYRIYRPHAAPITLVVDTPALRMSVDSAVPCGLIVNELVANALKHAFPDNRSGAVSVRLTPVDGDKLRLTVADNGVGMPPDFDLERTNSLGLQLAVLLAKQLDGTIELNRGQGTQFDITFSTPVA